MSVDAEAERRETNERIALRLGGLCFLGLAAYVAYEAIIDLNQRNAPKHSNVGIIFACVSLVIMPLLSRAERRVGSALASAAMEADAKQAEFCAYLSAILLGGLIPNSRRNRIYWAKSTTAWPKSTGVSQSKERNSPPFPVFNLVTGILGHYENQII
jgi:hypothetical protein